MQHRTFKSSEGKYFIPKRFFYGGASLWTCVKWFFWVTFVMQNELWTHWHLISHLIKWIWLTRQQLTRYLEFGVVFLAVFSAFFSKSSCLRWPKTLWEIFSCESDCINTSTYISLCSWSVKKPNIINLSVSLNGFLRWTLKTTSPERTITWVLLCPLDVPVKVQQV